MLSKDYSKAEKALEKAIQMQAKERIRLGLQHENLLIKKKAVIALGEIKDKQSVPDLIKTLSDNQIVMNGGGEIISMQVDLNKAIVSALEQLTDLRLHSSENLSSEDIKKILKKSREWWKVHQKEKQQ